MRKRLGNSAVAQVRTQLTDQPVSRTYLSCRNGPQRIDEVELRLLIGDRIHIRAALLDQLGDRLLDLTSSLGEQHDVLGQQLPVSLLEA